MREICCFLCFPINVCAGDWREGGKNWCLCACLTFDCCVLLRRDGRKSSVFFFSTSRWSESFVSCIVYLYVTSQDTKFCFQGILLSFLMNEFENFTISSVIKLTQCILSGVEKWSNASRIPSVSVLWLRLCNIYSFLCFLCAPGVNTLVTLVETRASVTRVRACRERVLKTRQNPDHNAVRSLLFDPWRRRLEKTTCFNHAGLLSATGKCS